jgi:hypothetical protein
VACALALMLLFALCFGLFALAADKTSPLNQRLKISTLEERVAFSGPSNNLYTFRFFGPDGASGALYQDGAALPIAEGTGFNFSARLISGAEYLLVVKNGVGGAVEIMRDALGRSFDRPIQLKNLTDGYDKVIARGYDTHWYAFTAPASGRYIVETASEIDTMGTLLDAGGREIAASDDAFSPYERNFRLEAELSAGSTYFLRVSAKGDLTGAYHLSIREPAEGAPELAGLSVSQAELPMRSGDVSQLTASVRPEGAQAFVRWVSTDQGVARVTQDGVVIAVAPGSCEVIAYSGEAAKASCRVTVQSIPIQEVHFELDQLELPRNNTAQLKYAVMPMDASDQRMTFESSDAAVAAVDESGLVTAVSEGQAVITLTSADGGHQSSMTVSVTRAEPAYRALLMGEQRYLDGRLRTGSINTTQGMADLLANSGAPGGYKVTMKLDSTREDLVNAIRDAFQDATPSDVSLFYINCHGGYDSGSAWLELHDGSRITARQLEQMLRKIPGTVIVMIDCCQSGAFLSATTHADFNRGVTQAFAGGAGASFAKSKYRVMTSSSSTQDSYRISFDGADSESAMATVFIRSLCEAGGWDLIKDHRTAMRADLDKDKVVTFEEAYRYTRRRVKQYLESSTVQQDVQVYPAGSMLPMFLR